MGKWKKGAKYKGKRRWRVKTLIKKYDGYCASCRRQVTLTHLASDQATVDHIIPLSKGGSEDLDNVQLLCRRCNQNKGDTIIGPDGDIQRGDD